MKTYYPRIHAELTVPVAGESVEKVRAATSDATYRFPLRLRTATLELNDHNHADSLKVSCEWLDAGMDPRFLHNATIEFYLGDAGGPGAYRPIDGGSDMRFAGIMTRPQRAMRDGSMVVELEFLDYTTLFLKKKHYPAAGVPDYGQRLDEAWARICDFTGPFDPAAGEIRSSVEALRDRLVLEGGLTEYPLLGQAVSPRFRGDRVHVKPDTDAWAVWQQCVGMCGLISFIRGDECVLTTATDYYTAKNPARLVWGENILDLTEARNPAKFNAVGLTSFDPLTGRTIEAFWPPVGDPNARRKNVLPRARGTKSGHASHARAKTSAEVRNAEDRTYYAYPEVTDPDVLTKIAQRVWEERSRQEVEGTLQTREMSATCVDGNTFDLVSLHAGDVVRIEFPDDARTLLTAFPTLDARMAYLMERGYETAVAELMARNMASFARLEPNFFVKSVRVHLTSDNQTGSFALDINYANRIAVDGSTPFDGQ
jgi:hypothetical protein